MAEAVVSAVVSTIAGNLNSLLLEELGLVGGLQTELQNLKGIFATVQGVLQDAEEKQWKSEALKTWLRDLKDAAYDADDVLDEFFIEAQRRRQQRDLTNRVRSCFSFHQNPLVFPLQMARKLKNVRENFDAIAKKRHDFHLMEGVLETECDSFDWRLTSSLVNESEIYGREKERKELIGMLLSNSDDFSVYAVCGMGGLGKTTLAQLVYNDAIVNEHFKLRIWVCVSDDFDTRRLTRAIIESIEGSPCTIQELDPLQRRLQEKVTGKRFLLILDDIWDHHHEKWNRLKDALRFGARGSAVVITTRMQTVALQMESVFVQQLGRLSDDDSWRLFERLAFGMRRREEYVHLETIGKAIVSKCGGVPLAIKAVGNLMRLKRNKNEWLSIKESEIWDQQDEGRMVLSALKLSYKSLPPHLKQCFAICCMFPKDYAMKKDQLVELWMANGFINPNGQRDLHEMGYEMFDELVGRSFFEELKQDGLGSITCKMHDLLHDLAQSTMIQECCLIEDCKRPNIPETVRHITLFERDNAVYDEEDLLKVQSPRSILSIQVDGNKRFYNDALCSFLSRQKHLRTLNLTGFMFETLPVSITNLKHLRHLDLSLSNIEKLPESISSLQNLLTLNLRDCWWLYKLPKGMKHMKSLIYLDLRGCDVLRRMPSRMGQLTSLRKLSMFIVGKRDGCHIGELQRLNYIGGELSIKNLGNVKGLTDAENANLRRKTDLQSLSLSWQEDVHSNISKESNEDVLRGLRPHSNLKKLEISGYGGSRFPDWMMDLLLPNLVEISLKSCMNCENLPPLGKLRFLKHLKLKKFDSVKCIGSEIYGDVENPFPSLERLTLGPMKSLEQWPTYTMRAREVFTRLNHLYVKKCPELVELPTIPSVKTLVIKDCSVTLLRSVMHFTSLTSLSIQEFHDLMLLPDGLFRNNTLLETLSVSKLGILISLSNQLDNLSSLKLLEIVECYNLYSLPEGLQKLNSLECLKLVLLPITGLCALPDSLATLDIEMCFKLTSLAEGLQDLRLLKKLSVCACSMLKSFPESIQHLTSLQDLGIFHCERLSCLPNQIGHLTSISRLTIWRCQKLMSLPEGIRSLDKLRRLEIGESPYLERRCKKERGEDWPKIAHIPIIVFNRQLIQSLDA